MIPNRICHCFRSTNNAKIISSTSILSYASSKALSHLVVKSLFAPYSTISIRLLSVLKTCGASQNFVSNGFLFQYRQINTKRGRQSSTYYYDVLDLNPNASPNEIKAAYYKKSKQHHPDVSKDPESHKLFTEIAEAYETLSNEEKKAIYDQDANLRQRFESRGRTVRPDDGPTRRRADGKTYSWDDGPPEMRRQRGPNYRVDEEFHRNFRERLRQAEEHDRRWREQHAEELRELWETWERERWRAREREPMMSAQRRQRARNWIVFSFTGYVTFMLMVIWLSRAR